MRPDGEIGAEALKELALAEGFEVPAANNRPVRIDDPESVWFVERGAVNVFAVKFRDGNPDAAPRHLVHAGPGRLVFGVDAGDDYRLTFKGLPDTSTRRIPLRRLAPDAPDDEHAGGAPPGRDPVSARTVAQLDLWVLQFVDAILREVEVRPRIDSRLLPGVTPRPGIATAEAGVAWLVNAPPGAAFLGLEPVTPEGSAPMTPAAWIDIPEKVGDAAVASSAGLAERIGVVGLVDTALADFHRLAMGSLELNRRLLLADTVNLRRDSASWRRLDESRARRRLFAATSERTDRDPDDPPLVAALDVVARHEGVGIRVPEPDARGAAPPPDLQEILDLSGLRRRRVRLPSEEKWWLGDHGALLAFRRSDGQPIALLPGAAGRYRAVDPAAGSAAFLGKRSAAEIEENAWQLYPEVSEGDSGAIGFAALFGVIGKGLGTDIARLFVTGLASGILTIVPALAIGTLLERVVPAGSLEPLLLFALLLAGASVIAALVHVLRGTAAMRIEGRLTARISAALLDRVLRVRLDAFKDFSTGELGMRVAAFDYLRDRVAGAAVGALLSTIFLLPTFIVVFLYSVRLGWVVLALGVVSLAVIGAASAAQIEPNRRHLRTVRRLSGAMRQFVEGVAKLRAARSQAAALAVWARIYRDQKDAEIDTFVLGDHITAFCAALPVLAGATIAAAYAFGAPPGPTVAEFLVVFAASMNFFTSIASFGIVFQAASTIIPGAEEVKPILEAGPERRFRTGRRFSLSGEMLLDKVSFRYDRDGPAILDNVTIRTEPGELVAIVGGSGAGKSTLLSLMLGLQEPTSGSVYFNHVDLSRLDIVAVRRQIGVVPQRLTLQPGSIFDNIVGADPDLTSEDAWRAVRLAALEATVRAMPMGLQTPVSENGVSLSGGERQRVAIAAALVRRPRILMLDEATSWLDSVTQERVMESIASVSAMRIVIGHRLATVREANRIYVLQAGHVVQEGSYQELTSTPGPFQDLVRRQIR